MLQYPCREPENFAKTFHPDSEASLSKPGSTANMAAMQLERSIAGFWKHDQHDWGFRGLGLEWAAGRRAVNFGIVARPPRVLDFQ